MEFNRIGTSSDAERVRTGSTMDVFTNRENRDGGAPGEASKAGLGTSPNTFFDDPRMGLARGSVEGVKAGRTGARP